MERIGLGFDSHKYQKGKGLILGGIFIECDYSFKAHSDGDIIIHSIIDAVIGALPEIFDYQNIGLIFPDNNPQYYKVNSTNLLDQILTKIHPWKISSCDVILIMEKPKLGYKIKDIIENLKKLLKTEIVNVKPKTAEGIGLIGKSQGAASFCIVKLNK